MKYLFAHILIFLFIGSTFTYVSSQSSAISLTVLVEGVENQDLASGSVVILNNGKYEISTLYADNRQIGVITETPSITLRRSVNQNVFDVNTSGVNLVKASNSNGKISVGDYVTSSSIKGTVVKSTNPEFVLGTAVEDFDSSEGLLRVEINPIYSVPSSNTGVNLLALLRNSTQSLVLSPLNSLRYVLAAVIGIASFLFGFSIFSKITGSGIQALGRNPLARRAIEINILVEFILNIALIAFGLTIAYLILVL